MIRYTFNIALVCLSLAAPKVFGQVQALDNSVHDLRHGESREWSEFPKEVSNSKLQIGFSSKVNSSEHTLVLRQYDVKQDWRLLLNDREIGHLVADEKDMRVYFAIPPNTLRAGHNELQINCTSQSNDDIRAGEIFLHERPLKEVLSDAFLELKVVDATTNKSLPARITLVDNKGSLQTVNIQQTPSIAARPGVVYTGDGKASFNIPAGTYKIYAGRGFEYGVDSVEVSAKQGDRIQKTLRIRREVDTDGWFSCDTHIHTVTHSGHGDATKLERAVTIAGEGIELPIMTDHNVYVDITADAKAAGVSDFFTPVTGDEVTTKFGHFNVFKLEVGTPVISHNVRDWNDVRRNINDVSNSKAIILNHARDIHIGFRPFDPERHLSSAGISKDESSFPANAMELINSGSQQTHIMNLFYDWFGMLNRGFVITPVGSSDSHDVSRYIVGQGRTYIHGDDSDAANINVESAIKNFKEGRVLVSMGLMAKLIVNDKYGPGDIVPASRNVNVTVEVWGPAWSKADRVSLYANGVRVQTKKIIDLGKPGMKSKSTWAIPLPKHDIFLVAIAEGPGDGMPFWSIAKPYQPASPDWTPRVIGSTGAVWIDADKNGRPNAAFDYAAEIIDSAQGDITKMIKLLANYDEAVAIQVAGALWTHQRNLTSSDISMALQGATKATKEGFEKVIKEIQLLK
jgi:hypothetical protein